MSALFEIEIQTWQHKLTAEQIALLQARSITEIQLRDDGDAKALDYGCYPVVDAATLKQLGAANVMVRRTIINDTIKGLAEFGQRHTTVENVRCNVAVAGLGLLTVNQVEVQTDMCTEALQIKLDEGWRILAVCVQPDQRRPDYILGRSDKPEDL